MKPALRTTALLALVSLLSCHNVQKDAAKKFPGPGDTVATAEMAAPGDSLNHFRCSVQVVADTSVADGVYDVTAKYGPNEAQSRFTMPKGGEYLIPIVRTDAAAGRFVIGFKVKGDTTFYDYFEVACSPASTRMHYLNSYSF